MSARRDGNAEVVLLNRDMERIRLHRQALICSGKETIDRKVIREIIFR